MKIGIVGAGAAGLAALRHSLNSGHECLAFEQTDKIGGTWNYTDQTGLDSYGLPIHSSMYQGLLTNLPKELMEYQDFHYDGIDRSFINQEQVLDYVNKFAEHYNLYPHIKFLHHIIKIHPLPNEKWSLREKNLETNKITDHQFDAIMICIGNYSVPKMPVIRGMELLGDKAIHSHFYRKNHAYELKRVLIIGAGPSGTDIAKIVSEVAEKLYISYNTTFFGETRENVIHKPLVEKFEGSKAFFADGSVEEIDNVIYCTGYQYVYPFLTKECGIEVENRWVKYLYKHIVNVEHPTMGFMGITFRVCPFPLFDIQARFFLEFIKNTSKFSKDEMIRDILKDIEDKSASTAQVHQIGNALHQTYFDDLANTVKVEKVRPVIHKLFQSLCGERNVEKNYRILNDEEFIEVN
ncbi:unnamed protein product [Ceutorhynchus assimilis]|uniref:Flavin-containing monooxygenase n=1 Tax=Ceutorhynchus assimilis TaxID=467358 RepID=A0A9N9MKU7_9CUCU|nr:unnamed protein product [Ceutorhynchus assimilis]